MEALEEVCECTGGAGCAKTKTGPTCGCDWGRYRWQKDQRRCSWCAVDTDVLWATARPWPVYIYPMHSSNMYFLHTTYIYTHYAYFIYICIEIYMYIYIYFVFPYIHKSIHVYDMI